MHIEPDDCLLVIDLQNDFCAGGALAVPDGDAVIPPVNRLARYFRHVVLTQDWHPPGHASFASSHPGRAPFDTVTLDYGEQTLWPDHCLQGSAGAAFHPGLDIPHASLILRKGFRAGIDSYSAFFENDRRTATGLAGYLADRRPGRVFVAGLALDFCVRYTVEDAAGLGLDTVLIADACRAVTPGDSLAAAEASFRSLGVTRVGAMDLTA